MQASYRRTKDISAFVSVFMISDQCCPKSHITQKSVFRLQKPTFPLAPTKKRNEKGKTFLYQHLHTRKKKTQKSLYSYQFFSFIYLFYESLLVIINHAKNIPQYSKIRIIGIILQQIFVKKLVVSNFHNYS